MHLRSITVKGFKSFPDRTRLEFAPGVSVIVGPNGSGKSNITEAVLWALGEQSAVAVRGQTMQDVIFAGGQGTASRNSAEVEVVIDNCDQAAGTEFSEISIVRRLDRSGEGEYRLNGARCRLVDVLEVLSDTGLGKEMHSVVSQGRVEAIIHSKARDRRLLIEEAAGLGKHRKRRRRAELKLARTGANLARALDLEREARARLRPLKRQAEAAELHERLERQSLELELQLARDRSRRVSAELVGAEAAASAAAGAREQARSELAGVAAAREALEQRLTSNGRARDRLADQLFAARSGADRIGMRVERAQDTARAAEDGAGRRARELESLEQSASEAPGGEESAVRTARLERELAELAAERDRRLERELSELTAESRRAEHAHAELGETVDERRATLAAAERAADLAHRSLRDGERALEQARREGARATADLAGVDRFLHDVSPPGGEGALAEQLSAEPGYERALAAVLGPLLRAGIVADLRAGEALLDARGADGASAIVVAGDAERPAAAAGGPPAAGAERLLDHVRPAPRVAALAESLLRDTWLVGALEQVEQGFDGIAVTSAGRVFFADRAELRQAPLGGEEVVLEQIGRRRELAVACDGAASAERLAAEHVEALSAELSQATDIRDSAERQLREVIDRSDEAAELVRRTVRALARRREDPQEPAALRHAQLSAELSAERRVAEQAESNRREHGQRLARLRARIAHDGEVLGAARRAKAALVLAQDAVTARAELLAAELSGDEQLTERVAGELRGLAGKEVELQGRLAHASDQVTAAEVRAQQARDAAAAAADELERIVARLESHGPIADADAGAEALPLDLRQELEAKVERLGRRREQLGPTNPLAKAEYAEAVTHVEELETQREDLDSALAELERLIRETDRRIRESFEQTFEAAAKNFEEVVTHLFPGGRGQLRLVKHDGPRTVIGGEQPGSADSEADGDDERPVDEPGVEVEVTPAGKSTKRLSLLSGGEKSLVALAFLFAVFLARPCPFYILDEVEAALDDLNIDRFLELVRRSSARAQFIVVTHQKRTMDAADCLYGVSMGGDGVSKVVSHRLAAAVEPVTPGPARERAAA